MVEWHLLTGEYPPQPGGVSDYTGLLARGLAATGSPVEVWAPPGTGPVAPEPGIRVHRLPDHFGRKALARLDQVLAEPSTDRRLLVQYVPHAFGFKAMNLPFCHWLYRRRRRERIWVMLHEVVFPLGWRQSLRHNVLGGVTHLMAALAVRAAERCFVSTPAWVPFVRRLGGRAEAITWLPVPSNLPTAADPLTVAAVRGRYLPAPELQLVGHFGTYGHLIASLLEQVVPRVLASGAQRRCLLVGRGSETACAGLLQRHPALAGRLFATGERSPLELAAHLAACDLLVQPYRDGVSTRRTSLMAGLALGVPVVTTSGALTEPFWQRERLAALAPAAEPEGLAEVADHLLRDPAALRELGRRGQQTYIEQFSLERTVQTLQRADRPTGPGDDPPSNGLPLRVRASVM